MGLLTRRPARPAAPARSFGRVPQITGMQLYTAEGARKYLTAAERDAFLAKADQVDRIVQTLCMTLTYSGCRLSKALALTVDRVDRGAGTVVFESLKKRRDGIYRAVPVPPALLIALTMVHGVREMQAKAWEGARNPDVALVADDRVAGGARRHGGRRARGAARLASRGYGTASGWPPSPPASRSTWCRNGSDTPSSPPRPSTPMPSAPRRRTSPAECGVDPCQSGLG